MLTVAGSSAQQQLKGHTRAKTNGAPIPDVYVMLMSADGRRILSYDYSRDDGAFTLDLPSDGAPEYVVSTSRLGFEALRQSVRRDAGTVELRLQETSVKLREVKVEAAPMRRRGDTLTYFMSNFSRPQDKTLAEVLERMPGIEVRSDGLVKYDGRPINRFYIEDLNLLGNRYSLATKNLSPADIASVQVYENHEPIKMMRGRTDPDEAALNIRLKSGSRAKWLLTGDFGLGGFPMLYDATVTPARFARRNQTLIVAKANNTGRDIAMELRIHSMGATVFNPATLEGIPDRLSPLTMTSAFFVRDRARFNRSAIASVNQLWRVADDVDLRLNLNYGYERESRSRSVETEYRLGNGQTYTVGDYTSQIVRRHKLEGEWTLTANRTRYFLENKLSAEIHWKDARADVAAGGRQMQQQMNLPRTLIKNHLKLSRLIGRVAFGFGNETEFIRMPQWLTVSSQDSIPLFRQLFVRQSIRYEAGSNDSYLTLNFHSGAHTLDLKTGFAWKGQAVRSALQPQPEGVEGPYTNDLRWRLWQLYAVPAYRFVYGPWTLTSSAMLEQRQTTYAGHTDRDLQIHPAIRFSYEPSAVFKSSASWKRTIRRGDLDNRLTGYVMKRYNLLTRGTDREERNVSDMLSLDLSVKDLSHFFNLSYMTYFSRYQGNLISAYLIRDFYTFSWLRPFDQRSTYWSHTLSATRLLTRLSLTAGLQIAYARNASTLEQQGATIDYTDHSFTLSPSLKWNARRNLNFDYVASLSYTGVSIDRSAVDRYIPFLDHRLYTYWGLTPRLSLTTTLQHYYTQAPDISATNLFFADLGLRFSFPHMTVSLDWTNLLNRRTYVVTGYNAINTYTRTDRLRPSEFLISFRFKR